VPGDEHPPCQLGEPLDGIDLPLELLGRPRCRCCIDYLRLQVLQLLPTEVVKLVDVDLGSGQLKAEDLPQTRALIGGSAAARLLSGLVEAGVEALRTSAEAGVDGRR